MKRVASFDADSGLIVTGHVAQQINDQQHLELTLAQLAGHAEESALRICRAPMSAITARLTSDWPI